MANAVAETDENNEEEQEEEEEGKEWVQLQQH
jgi:hypothetical protein